MWQKTSMTNFPPQVGSGYTVEGQKTGEEKFGGLQIEIVPSYEKELRTWKLQNVSFENSRGLDEQKTPSELKLNPGVKLRCYPSRPTYWAPFQISDLTGPNPREGTHVKVGFPY